MKTSTWKRIGLAFFAGGVVLLGAFLLVTGRAKALKKLLLELGIKKREVELAKLEEQRAASISKSGADEAKAKELEEKRKSLEKDNLQAELQIQGKTNDEIVAALRARGF